MSNSSTKIQLGGGSLSLGAIVFLVLLVLKLTGTAAISWFWVFFPLWIGPAIILGIFLLIGLVIGGIFAGVKILDALPGRRMKRKR